MSHTSKCVAGMQWIQHTQGHLLRVDFSAATGGSAPGPACKRASPMWKQQLLQPAAAHPVELLDRHRRLQEPGSIYRTLCACRQGPRGPSSEGKEVSGDEAPNIRKLLQLDGPHGQGLQRGKCTPQAWLSPSPPPSRPSISTPLHAPSKQHDHDMQRALMNSSTPTAASELIMMLIAPAPSSLPNDSSSKSMTSTAAASCHSPAVSSGGAQLGSNQGAAHTPWGPTQK